MLVTVDERIARLYEAKPRRDKAVDLREVQTLQNRHENEHERGRPDMMAGPGKRSAAAGLGADGGPHFVNVADSGEEESRRFAREVARWLAEQAEHANGGRLVVFSAARFLGLLRDEVKAPLATRIEYKAIELAQMPISELREHRALREALRIR